MARADEWTSWRGGVQQGRSATADAPLHWSPTQNVACKTELPGEGYSSPIVTAKSVYVTAAWKADSDIRFRLAVQSVLWLLLFLTVAPLGVLIVRLCRTTSPKSPCLSELFRMSGFCAMALLLCGLIFYGESLLDFHRAVERSWLAACLCGVLSLCVGLFGAPSDSRTKLAGGLALLGFAVLLSCTIPDRQHTVAADARSDVSVLIYLVIAVPALVGLSLLSSFLRHLLIHKRETHSGSLASGLRVAVLFLRGVPLLLTFIAAGVLVKLIRAQQSGTEATISVGITYEPHLPLWTILIPAGIGIVSLFWRWRRGSSAWADFGIVVSSAALLVISVCASVERLLVRIQYLSYLLGQPTLTPMLGKKAVIVFAVLCLVVIAVAWWKVKRIADKNALSLEGLLRFSALLLACVYFGYANYVPKEPRLERGILSIDRRTGAIQWRCGGLFATGETMHSDNSPATPTPATDGERIYAWFGTPGLMGADMTGKRLWINTHLPYKTREGVASSPIVCQGKVIVLSESDAGSYLAALDGKTGVEAWRTVRKKKRHSFAGNCRTPNIVRISGQDVIVVWGYEDVSGYDPQTGRELWTHFVEEVGTGGNPVASAVSDGNRLYLAGPYQTMCLDTIQRDTDKFLLWKQKVDDGAQCSSPVVANGLVFAVSDNGSAYCLDALTGKECWRKDLEQQHYASVVAGRNCVYFCDTQGLTTVVACDRTYRLLAQNDLQEPTFASFAPVDNALFIRTRHHLYCLHTP